LVKNVVHTGWREYGTGEVEKSREVGVKLVDEKTFLSMIND
jgi:hypothetical protein